MTGGDWWSCANLLGLGSGNFVQDTAFGAAGTLAGSFFGPIGVGIGSFLGTALGGLFGGLRHQAQ